MTAVVAYDIASDDRRAHVTAYLQSFGDRIQRSVFLLVVDPDALDEVVDRLSQIIEADADSVYIFRQCKNCWEERVCLGQARPPTRALTWQVL